MPPKNQSVIERAKNYERSLSAPLPTQHKPSRETSSPESPSAATKPNPGHHASTSTPRVSSFHQNFPKNTDKTIITSPSTNSGASTSSSAVSALRTNFERNEKPTSTDVRAPTGEQQTNESSPRQQETSKISSFISVKQGTDVDTKKSERPSFATLLQRVQALTKKYMNF